MTIAAIIPKGLEGRPLAFQRPGHVLAHQGGGVSRPRTQRTYRSSAPRSVAESHGEIAQPALVADPQDGAAGHAPPELLLGPGEELDQLGAVQAVAYPEVGLGGDPRVAVPGANELAVVAAEDPVADEGAKLDRDAPLELDREVGNAASRVQLVGRDDGARRADVDAFAAAAAMVLYGSIHRKRQVGVDVPEKEERPRLAGNQHGVLASPAQPRFARQLDLHHRRRVGEHAVTVSADFLRDRLGGN